MTDWRLGTVGFGYDEWVGSFYAPGLKPSQYLSYYADYFNAVEIDSTFYGLPREETVARWREQTPADFRFCPKTPKDITHAAQIMDKLGEMQTFVARVQALGAKLGPILLQFPPSFDLDQVKALTTFVRALPADVRYALEFRHRSWENPAVYGLLQAHGAAFVATDYIHLPPLLQVTTDFVYVRFIGEHGRFPSKDQEVLDQTERLQHWWEQIRPNLPHLSAVYAFFNNDYSGHSPAPCNRFKKMAGLRPRYPEWPTQSTLF